jgi:hypothetical protein
MEGVVDFVDEDEVSGGGDIYMSSSQALTL